MQIFFFKKRGVAFQWEEQIYEEVFKKHGVAFQWEEQIREAMSW